VAKGPFFDTLHVHLGHTPAQNLQLIAENFRINLRMFSPSEVTISLDETTSSLLPLLQVFNFGQPVDFDPESLELDPADEVPASLLRESTFLDHPVFNSYHTETEMLRYLRRLESRDLSLTTSMIPLGSCTMKLNATAEMLPLTWEKVARIHPFAPTHQARGYHQLFAQLESWLTEITGLAACSLQPNAGSQGEYAGLLIIRAWHRSNGQPQRNICLIPTSAHGTNPASAAMAGYRVVPVKCDPDGNISLEDLKQKISTHRNELGAIMITYPSTHGVFEENIADVCNLIHEAGAQVYLDGANMNALVGLVRPGDFGADVCHLNLHKTFCIPHGGGGPGAGPICVAKHLVPFLPTHPVIPTGGQQSAGTISAAPWGSASIFVIPWMYIAMMGPDGLAAASAHSILHANYIAARLSPPYKILYRGKNGLVAHECILDLREWKTRAGIEVEDIAKRLMDYGFHAPTMSWPVPGTLMIEPTESESLKEIDRFCQAMLLIHEELKKIESGEWSRTDNPLKNAPHPAHRVTSSNWPHPYSRETAAYPAPWLREHKFWPHASRVDNVFGDKHVFCTCLPSESLLNFDSLSLPIPQTQLTE
ncbi:MAG: aminomethyl-transferring glycine dehydrogenase, partial [Chthoniobacterales bacterium]|nr:aminomethyl-transferring glycine dehydrogenase [Chthoniobacterales bacterium]